MYQKELKMWLVENNSCLLSFSLVLHQAWSIGHPVRIKLTNNNQLM